MKVWGTDHFYCDILRVSFYIESGQTGADGGKRNVFDEMILEMESKAAHLELKSIVWDYH